MFQYAFGVAAADALGTRLLIDDERLRELFVLDGEEHEGALPKRIVSVGNDDYDEPEDVLARVVDDTTYAGYFQSEEFFSGVRDKVRNAFRLLPAHVHAFRATYDELRRTAYVCCHMRRTDYHTFAGGVALPMSYYESALARIDPPAGMPIIFVGDDLDEARAAFGDRESARFEQNDEGVDLQLLGHATSVVVSNSSFAWWGAWLNTRPSRSVYAPRHWLGYDFGWEYPPHVIPDDWHQIRVKRPWGKRLKPTHMRMSLGHRRQRLISGLARR